MESISPVYDGGEMSSKSNALEDFAENSRIKKTNKPRYPFLPSFRPFYPLAVHHLFTSPILCSNYTSLKIKCQA
jgi:hypothetical protein